MSAWKRQALEYLPECRQVVENSSNPMALWIDLLYECEAACENLNEDLIRRFYAFAEVCWKSSDADLRTAVACAFYEHLPESPGLRRDMPQRFGIAAFNELRGIFFYHLSPEEAAAFEKEFIWAKEKFAGKRT